jgi:hypothetical protein
MTETEVHEAVIRWLNSILDLTVIKDRQGIDRPATPYVMVDLVNFTELTQRPSDFDSQELDSLNSEGLNEVKLIPVIELEFVFLVFCYGDNSMRTLRKVQTARHLAQMNEPLMPALVIHEVGTINSVPEFVDERWEPRAQCNVVVRGISSDGFVVDTIEEHMPFDVQPTRERT